MSPNPLHLAQGPAWSLRCNLPGGSDTPWVPGFSDLVASHAARSRHAASDNHFIHIVMGLEHRSKARADMPREYFGNSAQASNMSTLLTGSVPLIPSFDKETSMRPRACVQALTSCFATLVLFPLSLSSAEDVLQWKLK